MIELGFERCKRGERLHLARDCIGMTDRTYRAFVGLELFNMTAGTRQVAIFARELQF